MPPRKSMAIVLIVLSLALCNASNENTIQDLTFDDKSGIPNVTLAYTTTDLFEHAPSQKSDTNNSVCFENKKIICSAKDENEVVCVNDDALFNSLKGDKSKRVNILKFNDVPEREYKCKKAEYKVDITKEQINIIYENFKAKHNEEGNEFYCVAIGCNHDHEKKDHNEAHDQVLKFYIKEKHDQKALENFTARRNLKMNENVVYHFLSCGEKDKNTKAFQKYLYDQKPWYKKPIYYFVGGLIILLVGGVCYILFTEDEDDEYSEDNDDGTA